ncbi:MAG: molybdopterin-dependent oxidoreductase [Chloroflexota bacterium]
MKQSGTAETAAVKEDVWIKSSCNICFNMCAIRAHRVDGVVVGIEGNPDCPTTRGGLCPRGASGIMLLYDPNRVNVPLKRTNPEKGIGIDPQWVEITWEEALDTITEKLKKIMAEDPRKMMVMSSVIPDCYLHITRGFGQAFGTPNSLASGAGAHCGGGSHLFSGLVQLAWTKMPDPNYVNYYLNFGCPAGFGAYYSVIGMAQRMADARKRGMKHVSIEPWLGMPGRNSDEWVPIRPGTDAALALAMVNLLLNEHGIFDAPHLKKNTNGPYLVGEDGYFLRDKASQKPLVWDSADGRAKTYDDPGMQDIALEGSYTVDGVKATTAFSLIKEEVKKYTPEMAAEITTVPPATIRRLAREFGEAACIGQTIVIDGKELPYRPVAVAWFRGASAHRHCALTNMALELLPEIMGANNVPGGVLGMNSRSLGHPESHEPAYGPGEDLDGMLKIGEWEVPHVPWPPHPPRKPEMLGLNDLSPTASTSPFLTWGITEREKYQIPYKAEFAMHTAGNYITNVVSPDELEKGLKKDIFIVSFSLFLDESTEFSDIILPDACYLERLDLRADWQSTCSPVDDWAYHLRQPVVAPMYQRRPAEQVILEIADRLGILGKLYEEINKRLFFRDPYKLDPAQKYAWEEIVDRRLKGNFGPERGVEWFKEHGLIKWPKKVEEVYWRPFIRGRVPIYYEYFKKLGEQIEAIKKEHGIPGFDTADFQPIAEWKPCPSFEEKRPEFDLWGTYYRIPVHTFTSTWNNPWLDEISRLDPNIFKIALNTETARKKGIKDGDWLEIESAGTGNKIEGFAVLTEGVHPEVVAYASGGGHWSKYLPIASQKGKGISPQWMIPLSWDYVDVVSFNVDACVKVKVTKKAGRAGK